MPITIPGVPEYLTRDQYVALIAAAGFDTSDIVELRFAVDGVHALVLARDESGCRVRGRQNGCQKHRIFIPVRRDSDDERVTRIRPVDL